jgi:predicted N-acetyltransferase YhbS
LPELYVIGEGGVDVNLHIRLIQQGDITECGRISYEAHRAVAAAHNFPPEQPSVEFSIGLINAKLKDPNAHGMLAERDGSIVGSIFLNYFPPAPVAVIGPLTVHPSHEGGVGQRLMEVALEEARTRNVESVRLVQSPSHLRSLVLYSKLGFDVREPLVLIRGRPPSAQVRERSVRPATDDDIGFCNSLCLRVHGLERELELRIAIEQKVATVVERSGRITGYATGIGFKGYAVGETTDDIKALISSTPSFFGPGFFVPTRNGQLFRWLLGAGLRAVWPANLMTLGYYQEPAGAFLPSIAF